jgi:hypothetical protein
MKRAPVSKGPVPSSSLRLLYLEFLNELLPTAERDGRIQSVDKAWDAMHRILCGGWLDTRHGDPAVRACVIGGRQLSNRSDWIISFVEPDLVTGVSTAIAHQDQTWFREQYFASTATRVGSSLDVTNWN